MQRKQLLIRSYAGILHYTGLIFIVAGLLILTPLVALFFWPDEMKFAAGFLLPSAIMLAAGALLWRVFRTAAPKSLDIHQSSVIVVLSWVSVILFSAWPLMAIEQLNFTQAVFEAVSGWTTTGLSVVNVEQAPHLILLWRSIMQFAGGAGLAIIMLATIVGPTGPALGLAEGRTDQLVPQVRHSAKLVMFIYSGYAVAGVAAYCLAGMNPFDAVNHTFPAISTGGFSSKAASIGYWDSPIIEAITIVLMILGNLNFLTAYLLLKRQVRLVSKNGEVRLMLVLIPVSAVALFFLVCTTLYPAFSKGVRVAIFETVSALTTTGFSTVTYNNWSPSGVFILILLMLIGGGTCSTAGGIKQYRIYVLYKSLLWDIKSFFLPRTAVTQNFIWQGERKDFISDSRIRQIGTYFFLYLAAYALGSLILAACGVNLRDALFEFSSALGTVGLSIGVTLPNASPVILWTESAGMFLGRLEFLVIFSAIIKLARDAAAALR